MLHADMRLASLLAATLIATSGNTMALEDQAGAAPDGPSLRFVIAAWTIDGGGTSISVGGPYVLSGTIGQPDAAPSIHGGGQVVLPGFWTMSEPLLDRVFIDGFE